MATLVCPACEHRIQTRTLRPGRFKVQCGNCQQAFAFVVTPDTLPDATLRGVRLPNQEATPPSKKSSQPAPRGATPDSESRAGPADRTVLDTANQPRTPSASQHSEHPPKAIPSSAQENQGKPQFNATAELPIGKDLGGYRLLGELGRGGLGIVYLANQTSLQRKVALKVIRGGLARNATVVARFIREAYAAAQLTHHNVVQIYDLGNVDDINFFSMEYVEGRNLAEVLVERGRIPPEQAATYILQAARGLQFAHNQGLVHRDIKPANLLLSRDGVVKVADLGLVKMAGEEVTASPRATPDAPATSAELTGFGTTLGTANYMAPEQAADSSRVDHRADIYALGCTFYALLAGTPPFHGKSLDEVVTLHRSNVVPRLERQVERLPPELVAIVNRMMVKRPEGRYQSLGETIRDLEDYLGIHGGADFHPSTDDVERLEQAAREYNSVPSLIFRQGLPIGFAVLLTALLVVAILFHPVWIFPLGVFACSSLISYAALSGILLRAHWMTRLRELAWIRKGRFAMQTLAALAGLGAGSWLLQVVPETILAIVLGGVVGWAQYFVCDRSLHLQRAASLESLERLLKRLRISGVDEDALHWFVAKYSGNDWEELFEELFGHAAKCRARNDLARAGIGDRKHRFRPWLDRWVDNMEQKLREHRKRADRKKLWRVEQAAFRQQGLSIAEAQRRAAQFASAFVKEASGLPDRTDRSLISAATIDPGEVAEWKRQRVKKLLEDARSGSLQDADSFRERMDPVLEISLGSSTRLLLGMVCLLGFAFWVRAHLDTQSLTNGESAQAVASFTVDQGAGLLEWLKGMGFGSLTHSTTVLKWPVIGPYFSGFAPLIAGLALCLSALMRGWKPSVFLVPAAGILLVGPAWGLPGIPGLGGALGTASLVAVICFFAAMLVRKQ